MDEDTRKIVEGWFSKAQIHLRTATSYLNSHTQWSEAIEAAQESIELSVKCVLSSLEINYSLTHGWDNDALRKIAEQIKKRHLIENICSQGLYLTAHLPRIILLANLWSHFYLTAKYGMEQGKLAPPQELFKEKEAKLAIEHADECLHAASEIIYLDPQKLSAITRGVEKEDVNR
jgi:HEPN domain-containing protein